MDAVTYAVQGGTEMIMLTVEDATKVAKRFCINKLEGWDDELEELLKSDMEQQAYLDFTSDDPFKTLTEKIAEISPNTIAKHVVNGDLKDWCIDWQVTMQMELMKGWQQK